MHIRFGGKPSLTYLEKLQDKALRMINFFPKRTILMIHLKTLKFSNFKTIHLYKMHCW